MTPYIRPEADAGTLRLHLNENTAGCSPRALERLRALTRQDAAFYPEYGAARAAVARHFDVPEEWVLLTNGLDEGILVAAAAAFRVRDGHVPEAIGLQPAFDMYEITVDALGGRMVLVPLAPGFPLPSQAIAAAVSERTRIVFVTNPHNPTGAVWNPGDIIALARQVAPVLLFVDEAYADFSATSILDRQTLAGLPNVVIGRTFAKAFGLAALRAGALVGTPETLAPMRRLVPPYSLNAAAVAALPAALEDRAYTQWYIDQCAASRERLTEACRRLGFRALPSAANFMLVEVGPPAAALVAELARRGIAVRDRSGEAGCAGCVRMTTGVLDDTERLVAALEDAWRAVQR